MQKWQLSLALALVACIFFVSASELRGQAMDKALITHQSESIGIAPLIYGIEKGFYRREGVDLQFRILRSDLAVSAIVGSREVDYMYGAGTAFRAGQPSSKTVSENDAVTVFESAAD